MKTNQTWSSIDKYLNKAHFNVKWLSEAVRTKYFNVDSLSKCQLMSKYRLIELVYDKCDNLENVLICGAWYGQLATMLDESNLGEQYTGLDIDPSIATIAEHLNRSIPYAHIVEDMYAYNYDHYDTVINTSCEHIHDLRDWLDLIPKGTIVILQSNNYTEIEDHINCSDSVDEFADKAGLSEIIVADTLTMPIYERYTIIGEV